MNVIVPKLKEVLFSVLPITAIVILLHFTLTPLETPQFVRFLIGAALIILGLTIFLIGVDIGITPIGNRMGSTIVKSNKIWVVVVAGLLLGFFISAAEPDLHILAEQVDAVSAGLITKTSIVLVVSLGIAVMLSLGMLRIVYDFPLYITLTILYGLILLLSFFTSKEFMAVAFDASGVTTGALTVPFILALAIGVSRLKKNSKSSEKDSFGLVAIASTGAIVAVMAMSILSKTSKIAGALEQGRTDPSSILDPFVQTLPCHRRSRSRFAVLVLFLAFQFLVRRGRHGVLGSLHHRARAVPSGRDTGFMEVGVRSVQSLPGKATAT